MFFIMLKKEIKLFFRSKGDVITLFLFPIILITILSLGLKGVMNSDTNIFGSDGNSVVYYSTEENSKYITGFDDFIKGLEKELKIDFKEVEDLKEVKNEIDEYKALAYVLVSKDDFQIYTSSKGENLKASIFKGILESSFNQYGVYETIAKFNPEALEKLVPNQYDQYVDSEEINSIRTITSSEYYTFAELGLIVLMVCTVVGESVYKERKLKTINRIILSKANEQTMIFSKVAMGVIIGTIQTLLVYVYSSLVLKVNWGENTLKYMLLYIALAFFASMLGAIVGIVNKNDSAVSAILFLITFSASILGGCCSTRQMITAIPFINKLAYLSPIYWINTAINTMICGLKSNLYVIALLMPVVFSMIIFIIYKIVMKKRGEAIDA